MNRDPAPIPEDALPAAAARWLANARDRVRADPAAIETLFPAAGRCCGRGPLSTAWRTDDAVRALLLDALPLRGAALRALLTLLYTHGDADERRGVLRALPVLDRDGPAGPRLGAGAVGLVEDAIRTNDPRLITAALGAYGARHLDAAVYRHAVLKCVFTGIPLDAIDGLDRRLDDELARMFADFARERLAAGRDVPPDVLRVLHRKEPA